jgi:hypothetical protein
LATCERAGDAHADRFVHDSDVHGDVRSGNLREWVDASEREEAANE